MTGTLRGPPQPCAFSSTPVLPQVLHCQSHHPTILPPEQDWSQKELLGAAVSFLKPSRQLPPALPLILPVP